MTHFLWFQQLQVNTTFLRQTERRLTVILLFEMKFKEVLKCSELQIW